MMKILVISNISDKTRSENILKQFASQTKEYSYEIVPAIMFPSQPSVGIKRSFCKAVEIAKKAFCSAVLILEDDFLCLSPTTIKDLIDLWYNNPISDGILLGGIYEGDVEEIEEGLAKVHGKLSGLNSIIIGEAFYDTILNAEEPFHLDYWISMEAKIPVYVMYPMGIIQNDGYSHNTKTITEYNKTLHLKYKLINPI